MGSYVPSTQAQREQMLRAVGLENVMDLYRDVPEQMLLREPLSHLLAKNPHWREFSVGEVLGTGFFELFELETDIIFIGTAFLSQFH